MDAIVMLDGSGDRYSEALKLARQHPGPYLAISLGSSTRSRLRFGRCFSGQLFVMTGSVHACAWPYEIAYEWAATIKALTLQREC